MSGFADQFIFPDHYVLSEPDTDSSRYDRRLIIKLPASQPPDTAIAALGIDLQAPGQQPSTYQNILKYADTRPRVINRQDFVSNVREDLGRGTWGGSQDWVERTSYNYY